LLRVAFFPLTMGNHVFVGERAVVNAALVGSYVYIGKNAIIVCVITFTCQIKWVWYNSFTINRTCLVIGQAVCSEGLLLHWGWCSCTTRNNCAVLYSFRWQSSHMRRRAAWVHSGSHGRLHEELLWALFTSTCLIFVYLCMYNRVQSKYIFFSNVLHVYILHLK